MRIYEAQEYFEFYRGDKNYFNMIKKKINSINSSILEFNVSDERLDLLYSNCSAVLYIPFIEDFCIIPFEAIVYKTILEIYKAIDRFILNKDKYIKKVNNNRKFVENLKLGWLKFTREIDSKLEETF